MPTKSMGVLFILFLLLTTALGSFGYTCKNLRMKSLLHLKNFMHLYILVNVFIHGWICFPTWQTIGFIDKMWISKYLNIPITLLWKVYYVTTISTFYIYLHILLSIIALWHFQTYWSRLDKTNDIIFIVLFVILHAMTML